MLNRLAQSAARIDGLLAQISAALPAPATEPARRPLVIDPDAACGACGRTGVVLSHPGGLCYSCSTG